MKMNRGDMLVHGFAVCLTVSTFSSCINETQQTNDTTVDTVALAPPVAASLWSAPDTASLGHDPVGKEIRYGRKLIANTSAYFGPNGSIRHSSNGMNCQNCHLDAGTKPWGNNYSAVASTYPKFRARSGTVESIEKRVNDCFERSLNGQPLDNDSREMKAIVAYIGWLGQHVKKGETPNGAGLVDVAFIDRHADPTKGKAVFEQKCTRCHGTDGAGTTDSTGIGYQYPPLWGPRSYNVGAGLYRLTRFAGYVKANMPFGATYDNPQLTDEEVWDLAAYVNSQPRPKKNLSNDYPDIAKKPVDYPFGPYADSFTQTQHKYGPFTVMAKTKKKS
jgi:thiosulfate dehydrogenase